MGGRTNPHYLGFHQGNVSRALPSAHLSLAISAASHKGRAGGETGRDRERSGISRFSSPALLPLEPPAPPRSQTSQALRVAGILVCLHEAALEWVSLIMRRGGEGRRKRPPRCGGNNPRGRPGQRRDLICIDGTKFCRGEGGGGGPALCGVLRKDTGDGAMETAGGSNSWNPLRTLARPGQEQ